MSISLERLDVQRNTLFFFVSILIVNWLAHLNGRSGLGNLLKTCQLGDGMFALVVFDAVILVCCNTRNLAKWSKFEHFFYWMFWVTCKKNNVWTRGRDWSYCWGLTWHVEPRGEPRWQGATIHGPITEVKQLWARSILGWVTIQDTVLVAKDVIVTCHVPLWLMSYEHTRGSQSALLYEIFRLCSVDSFA